MSVRLWLSNRCYPAIPVSEKVTPIPSPFDSILLTTLIVLFVPLAIARRPAKYLASFLCLFLVLLIGDQSRWQPWVYQYLFMLGALCVCFWSRSEPSKRRVLLNTCRLIVASIYSWSGVLKFNTTFLNQVFPSLINPYLNFMFGRVDVLPRWFGLIIPVVEVSIGVGLLTRKYRNQAVALAVVAHVFILLLLVPVGRNSVVWPWNVAMACFVMILFWRAKDFSWFDVVVPTRLSFQTAVFILFVVMPYFSLLNRWDSYLSSSLYTGNIVTAAIHVDERVMGAFSPGVQQFMEKSRYQGQFLINPDRWSQVELNVPSYPEERVFVHITKQLCTCIQGSSEIQLTLYGKPNWLTGQRETFSYACPDLRR